MPKLPTHSDKKALPSVFYDAKGAKDKTPKPPAEKGKPPRPPVDEWWKRPITEGPPGGWSS